MKFSLKNLIKTLPVSVILIAGLTGCTGGEDLTQAQGSDAAQLASASVMDQPEETAFSGSIFVISREDGSGTRGAFVELTGVEEKDDSGEKIDNTTEEASIKNNTSSVMTSVAENQTAIGYISLGSLNDTVKAVDVDGIQATPLNVKNGSYAIARPFNIATKEDLSEPAFDFINFIMSQEGQAVIAENKYIAVDESAVPFTGGQVTGKVVIAGSSSISPVMEKLVEAYGAVNSGVDIELLTSDSTTGMTTVIDGYCDIGMASRELKESELEKGLSPTVIALDGIAVIVNNANVHSQLSMDQIKAIFTGEVASWDEL